MCVCVCREGGTWSIGRWSERVRSYTVVSRCAVYKIKGSEMTFTSVWGTRQSPSFWTISLYSGANVSVRYQVQCNCEYECVSVCVSVCCCQAKQGRLRFFNTKIGTKLSKYVLANWWLGAIISFWQIWKDPLDISIKPYEKTSPQRYCALSVEWTTFCICHYVQFLRESPYLAAMMY